MSPVDNIDVNSALSSEWWVKMTHDYVDISAYKHTYIRAAITTLIFVLLSEKIYDPRCVLMSLSQSGRRTYLCVYACVPACLLAYVFNIYACLCVVLR